MSRAFKETTIPITLWLLFFSMLQAVAYSSKYGLWGNVLQKSISTSDPDKIEIDEKKPLSLFGVHLNTGSTRESLDLIRSLGKAEAKVQNFEVSVRNPDGDMNEWFIFAGGSRSIDMEKLKDVADSVVRIYAQEEKYDMGLKISTVEFENGRRFLDWIADRKEEVKTYRNSINQ